MCSLDSLSEKFINLLMVDGEKSRARSIFSAAINQLKNQCPAPSVGAPFNEHFHAAVKNVQPSVECKKCRVAGSSKLVPAIVSQRRGVALAMRWIIQLAREKRRKNAVPMSQCLAEQLIDAAQKSGNARQRRDSLHKLAERNRGYLRYRWW